MSGVPEATLRIARKAQAGMLTARCSVYRATQEPGSNKSSFVIVHRDMPCSVNGPKNSRAGDSGERTVPEHSNIVRFEYGSDVQAADLVKVGSALYEVVDTDADRTILTVLSAYVVRDTTNADYLIGK